MLRHSLGSTEVVKQHGWRDLMDEPRLKMGRVGDRTPPPGIVKDLASFDPELRLFWDVRQQVWTVAQRVKRSVPAGTLNGIMYRQVVDTDRTVLRLIGHTGEPDRRILPQLYEQRCLTREDRAKRVRDRMKADKKASKERFNKASAPAEAGMADGYGQLRRKGAFGKSAIVAPKGGWTVAGDA